MQAPSSLSGGSYPILGRQSVQASPPGETGTYPELHDAQAPSQPQQASVAAGGPGATPPADRYTFYAENIRCVMCTQDVDKDKDLALIYLQRCGHVYHERCVCRYQIGNRPERCLLCMPSGPHESSAWPAKAPRQHESRRSESLASAPYEDRGRRDVYDEDNYYDDDEDEDEDYYSESDEAATSSSDEEYRGEEYYREEWGDRPLSLAQRNALLKGSDKRWTKTFKSKEQITFDTLLDGDRTIDDLCKADLNLLDLYFALKVKQWDELIQLGMKKQHLLEKRGEFMPLSLLVDLYSVTYDNLAADLDLTLQDAVVMEFSPGEMRRLRVDFDGLRMYRLSKAGMPAFNYTMKQWKELGMNRDHLFELQFGPADLLRLNWDLRTMPKLFGLSPADEDSLGITQVLKERRQAKSREREQKRKGTRDRKRSARARGSSGQRARSQARARGRARPRGQGPSQAQGYAYPVARARSHRRAAGDNDNDGDDNNRSSTKFRQVPRGVITL